MDYIKHELTPIYDSQKSFWGKANVLEEDRYRGKLYLKSYDTIVAECDSDKKVKIYGYYSKTTTRHQKEFYKQFDCTGRTWDEVRNDY